MIDDRRTDEEKEATKGFVVATDKALSGWGLAPVVSYFALPVYCFEDWATLSDNLRRRSDMTRIREAGRDYLRSGFGEGVHVSVRSRQESIRHYTKGGF